MKRKVQLISLLFLTSPLFASTSVPNSLTGDTQWNADGSPYLIQGKVVVPKGAILKIGPNVKVSFQGAAALEVDGTLEISASAAAPAIFDMTQGGLQSEVFLNGADAHIENTKFLSGVFLIQDSQLHLQWFEMTKGSGLYLRGATTAVVKNGKIYGNATGVVMDGKTKGTFEFDTITENTYGLYLKSYSDLEFKNNSVHDNDKEVINNTPKLNLGGNYWGTSDSKAVAVKIQGSVDLAPMKSLNDILRYYVRTQLPTITKEMSVALAKKENLEKLELAKKEKEKNPATAQAPTTATTPVVEQPAPMVEEITTQAQPTPEAPTTETQTTTPPVEVPSGKTTVVKIKSLPAAPHTLKPLTTLPPDQGNIAEAPASTPPPSDNTGTPPVVGDNTTPPASTDVPLPPSTNAGTQPPPVPPGDNNPPVPPEVSGSTTPPAVPDTAVTNSSTAPAPPPVPEVIAPPEIETSTTPSNESQPTTTQAPTGNNNSSTTSNETVPQPPDLNEQVTPSAPVTNTDNTATTTPPAPPPVPETTSSTETTPPPTLPVTTSTQTTVDTQPTESQQKAVQSLNGVKGDIDGMQAPPLNIQVETTDSSGKTTTTNNSTVVLPPIKDSDVAPPKDLDLPPTDDLGNLNLDSKNK